MSVVSATFSMFGLYCTENLNTIFSFNSISANISMLNFNIINRAILFLILVPTVANDSVAGSAG